MASKLARSRPHFRKTPTSQQLIVNGKPFLMLAGELHNSSLSSASYMTEVWPKMKHMNINTILGSVTWEMIEPEEGKFDFAELDRVIEGARQHELHLVLLWFGSFKNAMSTYVPGWMKRDAKRFPRVRVYDADHKVKAIELISPFSQNCLEADCKAFTALMSHIKEMDEAYSTVLMVQVENEPGLLGDSRDRSRVANEKYASAVPADLLEYLQAQRYFTPTFEKRWPHIRNRLHGTSGKSWEVVFGKGIATEELFMADAFARYIGSVAEAGKKEYDIPFYANCWLNFDDPAVLDLEGIPLGEGAPTVAGGGSKAGVYPSGGPVPHLLDVWACHTQNRLDFISPDLYLHDYAWTCQQYRYRQNPLFIPEQRADLMGVRRTWLAFGSYCAIGTSPFGIDSVSNEESSAWRLSYGLLQRLSLLILEVQAERPEDMIGFFFDEVDRKKGQSEWRHVFEDASMEVTIQRSFVFGKPSPGYGIIIRNNGRFVLVGAGFGVTFKSTKPKSTFTGILSAKEKEIGEDGTLRTIRTLNGDETRSGACMTMPSDDPDYGGFPIRITIPARTYCCEVEVYSLEEDLEGF